MHFQLDVFSSSHSLPKFVLKEIADNGKIKTGHGLSSMPFNDEFGVKNTLKFQLICDKCDNTLFQEYENLKSLCGPLSDVAINEIAIKNYLRFIYKRRIEQEIYLSSKDKEQKRRFADNEHFAFLENRLLLCKLDIESAEKEIKRLIRHKTDYFFYVIDEIDLDYKTKIAFQGFIALVQDFDGKIINEIYNYDPNYNVQHLGLCIFPHPRGTKIILYSEDGNTRLRSFYKRFKKLSLEEKLYTLNYILLMYDEDWCIGAEFDENLLNEETKLLINQTTDYIGPSDNPFFA